MRSCLLLLALLGFVACGSRSDRGADTTTPLTDAVPPPGVDAAPWAVSSTGAGPVRVGMTRAELLPLVVPGADTSASGNGCSYLSIAGAPDSLGFMIEGGVLVRIDVRGGPTPTREGVRVGDPVARVQAQYPGVTRRPHKYVDGWSYLIAIPGAPGDTLHRLVFEVDTAFVRSYRAGVFPPVEYVEGCS